MESQIEKKSCYSLVIDMKAELLEKDKDFGNRLNKSPHDFNIKKIDLDFLKQELLKVLDS